MPKRSMAVFCQDFGEPPTHRQLPGLKSDFLLIRESRARGLCPLLFDHRSKSEKSFHSGQKSIPNRREAARADFQRL